MEQWENFQLDENDCWMYQLELEKAVKMNMAKHPYIVGRYLAMLRLLANQARRAIPPKSDM